MKGNVFEEYESNVRSYCRSFPAVFHHAKNALIFTESGERYIDFFAGAGALNYGHNNDYIKERLLSYLQSDGILHGLDMYTTAKRDFISKFQESVLIPRGLMYKLQFCGSTGTNAVEAALKLARKVKQRTNIFAFMGGFHGMSLGSLAATGNLYNRAGAGVPLDHVTFMPYPHGYMATFDTIAYMETVLNDANSGIEKPAAVILETVQAEGGVIVTSPQWLQQLSDLCHRHDILLICDDIQVGCGRTGPFFSFERAGIKPDIVILSKSISGCGLPMSLLLLRPDLDQWQPGEHNGTFRGNQLAFVAANAALEYREQHPLETDVLRKAEFIYRYLTERIGVYSDQLEIRGLGLIWGIDFARWGGAICAQRITADCFRNGLIIERAGRDDTVVKLMPPLTIEPEVLEEGCTILYRAVKSVLENTQCLNRIAAVSS